MTTPTRGRLTLSPDIRFEPYWWADRNREAAPEPDLPASADVAIVGGGYTGLSAALTLAQAGQSVIVFDTLDPGDGASTRNGGMVGNRLKDDFRTLVHKFGDKKAIRLMDAAAASVDFLERRTLDLGIDCDFGRTGRYTAAVSPAHYKAMEKDLAAEKSLRPSEAQMIPAEEQSQFLSSPMYFGGRLQPDTAAVHPAKLHDGMLAAARRAGVTIAARTEVISMEETDTGWALETGLGYVAAASVLVCTNGYTGPVTPDQQSRSIPVTSAMIATEELDPDLVQRLIPNGRMITDTYNLLSYFRPSPDGKRILLGSRPGIFANAPEKRARFLGKRLGRIFPELDGVAISHFWEGKVAFSFDRYPKIGFEDNLGYAMCYGGSGVAMSNWMGHKLAQKAMGDLAGRTPFDDMEFPGRFYYSGWPWFLGPAMAMYQFRDYLNGSARR